jgi:hypothetical protein
MQTVELDLGPPPPSYGSFAESVEGAEAQPEQALAKSDSALIGEARLQSGQFGTSSCLLSFSNGLNLVAQAHDFQVHWKVSEAEPSPISAVAPRRLLFKSGLVAAFDPSSMLDEITSSEFVMLAVTGRDLLVYTRGNEIFWLSAYREKASANDLLYAFFET